MLSFSSFTAAILFGLTWSLVPKAPVSSHPMDVAPPARSAPQDSLAHSYLVMGAKTAIIREDASVEFEYDGGTRDGWLLPSGNLLLAFADRVVEITREKKIVLSYTLSRDNAEIGTTQRLYDGSTLVTELGKQPRLLVLDRDGKIVREVKLQPETDNAHLQTRMARELKNGNFLVPHLLAFAIKEYRLDGSIVREFELDRPELAGRSEENWPFTAIRLDDGNTLVSLTHGNKVAELDPKGAIVWLVRNEEVENRLKDPCGCQRLANGNTVIGSHAAWEGVSMIEITRDKKIVWTSEHPLAAGVHHFQILSTNGVKEPGTPMR